MEQALQLKEKAGDDTGRSPRAVRVRRRRSTLSARRRRWCRPGHPRSDEAIAGSDYAATSLVLAKAVEKAGPESGKGTW